MQDLSKTLSEVMPLLVSNRSLNDPREQQTLRSATLRLASLSHNIAGGTAVPTSDETVSFVAREFKSELRDIQRMMDSGQWMQAHGRLEQVTNYCIACHTMTSGTTSGYSAELKPPPSSFSRYDKARYFASIRQFEQAIVNYEYALVDQVWAKDNPELWNKGFLSLLTIVARVKRDPNLVRELISQFYDTGSYPSDLKMAAQVWRNDVKEWDRRRSTKLDLAAMQGLIRQADAKEQKQKHAGLIPYIRASSGLNELLRAGGLSKSQQQNAYYNLGKISEHLADLNFVGFARDYYQMCIENGHGKKLTSQCRSAKERLTSDQL